jgi:hypothetical protein
LTPSASSDPILPVAPTPTEVRDSIRPAVEKILGTKSVKRVRRIGRAQVWVRARLSRRTLMRFGQAPGVVVLCTTRCRVQTSALLAAGRHPILSSRRRSWAIITPLRPDVVSLALGDLERDALDSLRRPRAKFTLKVRAAGKRATKLKRSIRIGP